MATRSGSSTSRQGAAYASATKVSPAKSRAEIEALVEKYGARGFGYLSRDNTAIIAFEIASRSLRFVLPLPLMTDREIVRDARGYARTASAQHTAYEQAVRQRWRALALSIKARFAAIDAGIETLEHAFLAETVLPDGTTAAEWLLPQIADAQREHGMPRLLLAAPGAPGAPEAPRRVTINEQS